MINGCPPINGPCLEDFASSTELLTQRLILSSAAIVCRLDSLLKEIPDPLEASAPLLSAGDLTRSGQKESENFLFGQRLPASPVRCAIPL